MVIAAIAVTETVVDVVTVEIAAAAMIATETKS